MERRHRQKTMMILANAGNRMTVTSAPVTFAVYYLVLMLLVTVGGRGHVSASQVVLPTEYISVGDYTGTANERIDAAIADAMATTHKTVFFPNGTYALRTTVNLNQGADTELHLIGESRDGVQLIPDIPYLEANYDGGNGDQLAHMINLGGTSSFNSVFNSVDVTIQNMTLDMQDQEVLGHAETFKTVGHGIRVGKGWEEGQFTVNEVTIRNTNSYGVGIQDRGGHPKNNITLTNLNIERTGSDGIDTKEAGGDGNRNLVIRNVSVSEVGFLDTGAAPAIDVRYRDAIIENVNLVSQASRSTLPGQTSTTTGIVFRPFEAGAAGIVEASVSDVYIRGFNNGIIVGSSENTPHQNIDIRDFRVQGQQASGVRVSGNNHSGHVISDGFVDPAFGGAAVNAGGQATVTNVIAGRWDPALTPTTDTTFESNVSLAGDVFSPAWEGIVGSERVSLNPSASGGGAFVFDATDTGTFQIDFDGVYHAMDKLIVDGTLKLGGEFQVNLIDGTPTVGGEFHVFDANAITGTFDKFTLPSLGGGFFWDTDKLSVDGTIALLRAESIMLGDANTSYGASDADDNPPIDAAFRADVQSVNANWSLLGLDEDGRNDARAMTFSLDPLDAAMLDRVWIEARIAGLGGYENDVMVFDFVGNNRRLDTMEGFVEGGGWMTLRYDLDPSEFDLLSDGQLNLAFFDDTRVDWVTLNWALTPATALLPGDFDQDGVLTLADLELLRDMVNAGSNDAAFDLSSPVDGLVDSGDLTTWVEELFGSALGDANLDGAVNGLDAGIVLGNFGVADASWGTGDFNGDGVVNGLDVGIVLGNFGFGAFGLDAQALLASDAELANALLATIPEPATITLSTAAAAVLASQRRKTQTPQ